MKTSLIGNAAKAMGAGRERKEDLIDPAAGIVMKVRVGDHVEVGNTLYELHASGGRGMTEALNLIQEAIQIGDCAPEPVPLVYEVITE